MNLLVTNDDGIDSLLLHELARALLGAGHRVAVVAPAREQSWIGAAKSRHRPVASSRADRGLGCPTWIVDGTPSDCVNIALAHLLPRDPAGQPAVEGHGAVEAVVSGINTGRNTSIGFILASGTIGGAWEGALHGLPAIALSQELTPPGFHALKQPTAAMTSEVAATIAASVGHAARLTGELLRPQDRRPFTVHSVNFPFPCRPESPVRLTVPARISATGMFGPAEADGVHRFAYNHGVDLSPDGLLTDRACLAAGEISHTVLDYTRLGH
jgi:5'-nucleotidase